MPSTLNSLLRQLDNITYAQDISIPTKCARSLDLVKSLDALLADENFEVTRDLFDGISNDTRRLFLASFVINAGALFSAAQSAADKSFAAEMRQVAAKAFGSAIMQNKREQPGRN
jgi:hypothetical protein